METRWAWSLSLLVVGLAVLWLTPPQLVDPVDDRLERLLDGIGPHPVGSPAAGRVSERIRVQLDELGIAHRTETHGLCEGATCLEVQNLVASVPGSDPDRWLLLSTHYDSVWAGPGAGDALSGVAAALEILAQLQQAPLESGLVVLFDEGEEANLYGAKAFTEQSVWRDRIEAGVNLEARGTSGPAYLFEITGDSLALGRAYARHARRPAASSLYVAIYRMLPNNTDVAVFEDVGIPFANVAFLGHGERYHTPLDDLSHLDPRSVQHLVDQGLGLLRALDAIGPDARGDGQAVLFDVFGLLAVAVGVGPARGLALLAVLGSLLWARPSPTGVLRLLLMLLGVATTAFLADRLVYALGGSWDGTPSVGIAASWLLAASGVMLLATSRTPADRTADLVGLFAVLVGLCALFLPEALYLPGLGLPLLALAARREHLRPLAVLAGLPLAVLAVGLPDALGPYAMVVAAPAFLALLPVLPLLPHPSRRDACLPVVALLCMGSALILRDAPAALLVEHRTDGSSSDLAVFPARFPRGGPTPDLRAPAPPTGFAPASLRWTTDGAVIQAPGGLAVQIRADVPIQWIGRTPVDGRRSLTWLGDTQSLVLDAPGLERLSIAVARPLAPEHLASEEPWHPIHTGARTWSEQHLQRP